MKVFTPSAAHSDLRGSITDILTREPIESVTRIDITEGSIRGNHYHQDTVQYIYLLSGRILYRTRTVDNEIHDTILTPGDLLLTEPKEAHAMQALNDSSFMVFTRGPRSGADYESDTFRLEEPLI